MPCPQGKVRSEESSSFLKKGTKKLLLMSGSMGAPTLDDTSEAISESFLVLFFKKELLPSWPSAPFV
jgi:hypothetical protein